MNQSQFLAINCNSLEAREESRVHGATGFGLASHWLKNWRESFKPITTRSNHNHVINFDSHLKTALMVMVMVMYLYTAHIPIRFMAVYNSFFSYEGGEIGRHLVKTPLAAAISLQLISPTRLTHT